MQMIGQRAFGGGNQRPFYNTSPVGSVTNLGDLNGFGRKNFNNITGPDIKSPASAGTYPNYNQFGMRDV
jgi:hypothetical protein